MALRMNGIWAHREKGGGHLMWAGASSLGGKRSPSLREELGDPVNGMFGFCRSGLGSESSINSQVCLCCWAGTHTVSSRVV